MRSIAATARAEREIEQRNGLAKAFALPFGPMNFRGRDANGFAGDLHDRICKRRRDAVDGGGSDHALAANDGGLGGRALVGAGENGNDAGTWEIGELDFSRGAVEQFAMFDRNRPHVRFQHGQRRSIQ